MGSKPERPASPSPAPGPGGDEPVSRVGDLGRGSHEQTQGGPGDAKPEPEQVPPPPD
jgi:hypothetical protein